MDEQESVRCSAGTNEVRSLEKYGSAQGATEIRPFMAIVAVWRRFPILLPQFIEGDGYRCSSVEYNPVVPVWRKL